MPRWLKVTFEERVILLGTASLFALAAALAIQFVAPTYRAELTLGPIDAVPALGDDRELTAQLEREGIVLGRGVDGPGSRILHEIEAVRSGAAGAPASVWVETVAGQDATVRIMAAASSEETARRAAALVGESFIRRSGEANAVPAVVDPDVLSAARQRVAEADAAYAAAEALPQTSLADAGQGDLEGARAEIDAYRDWLAGLIADSGAERSTSPRALDDAFQGLLSERDRLEAAIVQLELTLLDGHPRLRTARVRLRDLDAEIVEAAQTALAQAEGERAELGERIAAREAAAKAPAARNEAIAAAAAERDAARSALDALEGERQAAPAPTSIAAAAIDVGARRPSAVGPAAAAGLLGLVLAALFVILRDLISRRIAAGARLPAPAFAVNRTVPVMRAPARDGHEGGSREEIVSGLLESGVRRAIVLARSYDGGSIASVDIARRLTLEGRSVLLVDLSTEGRAATAMGLPAKGPALGREASSQGLRSLVSRDFATNADALRGRDAGDASADTTGLASMRTALQAAERDYDIVIIEANEMPADRLHELAEEDVAVLLSVEGFTGAQLDARLAELAAAGVEPPLLVLPSRRPDAALRGRVSDAARAPSS